MRYHRTLLGLAVTLAGCVVLPSAAAPPTRPAVSQETTRQLTVAARTLLEVRSQALVSRRRHNDPSQPTEVLGVRIAPDVARTQERAVRELESRNRAPVEGGPAFTGVQTSLAAKRAVRTGDLITLEAVEHTEVRYDTGKVTQSVRRGFEFTTKGEEIVLVRERVLDPEARPINDPTAPAPDPRPEPEPKHGPESVPGPAPTAR